MRIISVVKLTDLLEFTIYDSVEEITAAGVPYKTVMADLELGEYFRFDNGVYVPLMSKCVYRGSPKKAAPIMQYTFPRFTHIQRETGFRIPLVYNPDTRSGLTPNNPRYGARERYFIALLENNVDVYTAFNEAFKDLKIFNHYKKMEKVFAHPRFKEQFIKGYIMDKMQAGLSKAGVDQDFLAQQIKAIIEDPKAPAPLRQYAIELTLKSINAEHVASPARSVADSLRVVAN